MFTSGWKIVDIARDSKVLYSLRIYGNNRTGINGKYRITGYITIS